VIKWIRRIILKNVDKEIKDINSQINSMRVELNAIDFLVQKQSELIAALAAVQSDILAAYEYENTYVKAAEDGTIVHKIIMSMPDDDDLLN